MSKNVYNPTSAIKKRYVKCPISSHAANKDSIRVQRHGPPTWSEAIAETYTNPDLRTIATRLSVYCGLDADDVIHAAVERALDKGHAGLPTILRLISCMESIASTNARSARRSSKRGYAGTIDTDDLETRWHMCSYVDPEQECERRWRAHFIAMVYDEVAANDNAIEQMVDAMADKKRGANLREALNLSQTEYESKRKKMQRRVRSICARYTVNGRLLFDVTFAGLRTV